MKSRTFCLFFSLALLVTPSLLRSQTYDTISNWDGIVQDWHVHAGGSEIVENPYPEGINLSAHCLKIITSVNPLDFIYYNMPEYANFDQFPRYNLKIRAPLSGGSVTLKFENSDNTESHEIEMTPVPGQWTDLGYDFSGLSYNNLSRMVIFIDFQGTEAGHEWYIDDITKEVQFPTSLQSTLPLVVINTFGVSIPDEPKITAHMGIIDNGPGQLNNISDPFNDYDGSIGIEIHGQSSQMFPKKTYALETRDSQGENLNVPLLGMPEENDWILSAPYSDKSMLRNFISFWIARQMGSYHPRTRFCEVIINGNYKGVYMLMEKIKKDAHRVDIATLNPDEVSGDDLTGGYIVKVDKIEGGFTYGTDGWRSHPVPSYPGANDITFQYYYPEPADLVSVQREYIRNYITGAENRLTSSAFTDPGQGYHPCFDACSFVDMMLLNEISKEVDKYRYSTFFYKDKESNGGKLIAGPAWDFDLGYGNVDYWAPGVVTTGWVYSSLGQYMGDMMFWWKRLMEDPYFRDLAKTRWLELRQGPLSDAAVASAADSIVILIDEAKDRNYERWPILGTYIWPNYNWQNNDYNDEVSYFNDFLFNRLHWMDNNMPGNRLQSWISITAESNRIKLKLYGNRFSRTVLKAGHFALNDAPPGLFIEEATYVNASECILTLSTAASGFPDISVTAEAKILDTRRDLISNKLASAGTGEAPHALSVKVFPENGRIHICCDQPERLPRQIVVMNATGQRIATREIGKCPENILSLGLIPGLYLILFELENQPMIKELLVVH